MAEAWVLHHIYKQTGDVPLAVGKDLVVWEDETYIYIDTGLKPEEFVEESRKAGEEWMKE